MTPTPYRPAFVPPPRPWRYALTRRVRRSAALTVLAATLVLPVVMSVPSCGPPIRETVRVAVVDCREPQRGWIVANVGLLDGLGIHFQVVDSSESPAVTVRCGDLSGPHPAAGSYTLGTDEVVADPVYAPGEFGISAVVNHELVHWYIGRRGTQPDRARYHVCAFTGQTPYCYPGTTDRDALMVPSLGGGMPFDPGFEHVDVGDIPQNTPRWSDQRFFEWATGRSTN